MKIRKSSVKDKASEQKVRAWKVLCQKAFGEESSVDALKAIIELAETGDGTNARTTD